MIRRPTLYTAEIAERILERLASGCSLSTLCRDEGMPPPSTVLDWVRQDRDGLAARYQDAREIGNPAMRSYVTLYTDAVAERMLCELRRGRALRDVCQDDGMPAVRTVTRWVENDREGFGARYLAARTAGQALMARYMLYTPELAELILDELCNGRTLADVCGDPAMPSIRTVNQWVRENREGFNIRYRDAREIGCYTLADQALDIADDCRDDWTERQRKDGTIEFVVDQGNIKRSRLRVDTRQWRLSKMLPKRFGDRPNPDTGDEGSGSWADLLKAVDGRSRGLPNSRPPLHQTKTE
jgi:transposase-like protein